MHTHQFFTWTTHTAENTTLLDYKTLQWRIQDFPWGGHGFLEPNFADSGDAASLRNFLKQI